jgi:RHS repeat-associated protein
MISIREVKPTGPNTDTWYAYDRLGSVCLTTDASGASKACRWQDAYGNQLSDVDTGAWASASASEGYGLTSRWYDGDVELLLVSHRWEDPTSGRFMSTPFLPPSREHPYTYCADNPGRFVDPYGLWLDGPNGPVPSQPGDFPLHPRPPDSAPTPESVLGPCISAPPARGDSGICHTYCESDTYIGWNAKCVCEKAGESAWDQHVRGCLACAYRRGLDLRAAHRACYRYVDATVGGGFWSRLDIGLRLSNDCFFNGGKPDPDFPHVNPVW